MNVSYLKTTPAKTKIDHVNFLKQLKAFNLWNVRNRKTYKCQKIENDKKKWEEKTKKDANVVSIHPLLNTMLISEKKDIIWYFRW